MSNETKLCKHCQTEIPKKAKVCPNCKKNQGGIGKWILIAVVAVVLIAVVAGGESEPKLVENTTDAAVSKEEPVEEVTAEPKAEEPVKKETFGIGETAEMNDVQVTMTNYAENTGSQFNKPTEGNVFVLVEFEIANNTSSELAVSSILSFEGYADGYALNYSFAAEMENSGGQLDGTIAPGKKMKGNIGYEVPADWSNIEVYFADSVWNNNKFKFQITK